MNMKMKESKNPGMFNVTLYFRPPQISISGVPRKSDFRPGKIVQISFFRAERRTSGGNVESAANRMLFRTKEELITSS